MDFTVNPDVRHLASYYLLLYSIKYLHVMCKNNELTFVLEKCFCEF